MFGIGSKDKKSIMEMIIGVHNDSCVGMGGDESNVFPFSWYLKALDGMCKILDLGAYF